MRICQLVVAWDHLSRAIWTGQWSRPTGAIRVVRQAPRREIGAFYGIFPIFKTLTICWLFAILSEGFLGKRIYRPE